MGKSQTHLLDFYMSIDEIIKQILDQKIKKKKYYILIYIQKHFS